MEDLTQAGKDPKRQAEVSAALIMIEGSLAELESTGDKLMEKLDSVINQEPTPPTPAPIHAEFVTSLAWRLQLINSRVNSYHDHINYILDRTEL